MKHILVTGASGQLGQCLSAMAADSPHNWTFLDRAALDLSQISELPASLGALISAQETSTAAPFTHLIHAAAFTQVDAAETNESLAFAINDTATEIIAKACAAHDICLLYMSTDFVFSGPRNAPWKTTDSLLPKGVYAASKAAGEAAVAAHCSRHYIVRTSWLYSPFGHNFVKSMLRLATSHSEVKVVSDQTGSPTSAMDLAAALVFLIENGEIPFGTHHFSNSGTTTWAGFAKEIFKQAGVAAQVLPITSAQFAAAAPRPAYSVLANSLPLKNRDWTMALSDVLAHLNQQK